MSKRKNSACNRSEDSPTALFLAGYSLEKSAVTRLEEHLKRDPEDLSCRQKLMSYYFKTCHSSKSDAKKHLQSVLWNDKASSGT